MISLAILLIDDLSQLLISGPDFGAGESLTPSAVTIIG